MFLARFFTLAVIALLFCGCTNFQGATALEFFSHLDKSGRWKTTQRTDFEGRILPEDVVCIEAEISIFDSTDSKMKFNGSAKKCWDEYGILIDYIVKDSSHENLFQLKSKTKNGYLLSRDINFRYSAQPKSEPLSHSLQMTKSDNGTRTYTQTSDSKKDFEVQFLADNEKIVSAQINYPFSHELEISYKENGDIALVIDKNWGDAYKIDYTNDEEDKIVYNREIYSYRLKKMNANKQMVEEIYIDEFSRKKIHRKYTYTADGRTATIWANGVSRNIIYENGIFVREEYYDYAETLRQVVEIEIDSHGNVIKSSYIPKNTGNQDNKIKLQYKYAITYREM